MTLKCEKQNNCFNLKDTVSMYSLKKDILTTNINAFYPYTTNIQYERNSFKLILIDLQNTILECLAEVSSSFALCGA
jgi:hypothetical protein